MHTREEGCQAWVEIALPMLPLAADVWDPRSDEAALLEVAL